MKRFLVVAFALVPALAGAGVIDTLWLRQYIGTSSSQLNQIADIAVDTLRNSIYVCGSGEADPYGGTTNILIQRYDLAGNLRWTRSEGGNTGSQDDMGHALAVDSLGNVFVAGHTYNSMPRGYDATWLKYDTAGTQLFYLKSYWEEDDAVYDLVIGDSGHIYMCGTHVNPDHGLSAYLLIKANGTTGNIIWSREYIYDTMALAASQRGRDAHPLFFEDYSDWDNCGTSLARLPSGKIAVAGFALDENRDRDMWTMLFSPDGTRHWARIYYNLTTTYHDDDVAFDVAASLSGDIYVGGFDYLETDALDQGYNYALIRYDTTGVVLQSRSYNVGGVDGDDYVTSICLDNASPQNVYTTGVFTFDSPDDEQIVTHRFSRVLTPRWGTTGAIYGGVGEDRGNRVLHAQGRVYVAGIRDNNVVTLCYTEVDPSGQKDTLWAWHFAGPAGLEDYASAVVALDTNRVYVGGQTTPSISPYWNSTVLTRLGYVDRDLKLVVLTGLPDTVPQGELLHPGARVANIGTSPATGVVRLRIGDGYRDTLITGRAIQPGETLNVSFADWLAAGLGAHAVRCTVATSGDPNLANNVLHGQVFVAQSDVASLRIVSPRGVVAPGTRLACQAWVRNLGVAVPPFDVVFRVGAGFADTAFAQVVPPGESLLVTGGRSWTATVGEFAVVCSTELAGDVNPGNDRAEDIVTVPGRDVGLSALLAPAEVVPFGQEVLPRAVARNYGLASENLQVLLSIGAGYLDTVALSIRPGDSAVVNFDAWNPGAPGQYPAVCWTRMAGDLNPANDTIRRQVTVRYADASLDSIIDPQGAVDSGSTVTPKVMVTNHGSLTETLAVRFTIHGPVAGYGPGAAGDAKRRLQLYVDSTVVEVRPGATASVSFAPWVAGPSGTLPIEAQVFVAGDAEPANDLLVDTISVRSTRHDIAVLAVLAPIDSVDSGDVVTPTAVIANYGAFNERVNVVCNIGTGYTGSIFADIAASAIDTVTFSDWTAAPVGANAVVCYSRLADDADRSNDTCESAVYVRSQSAVSEVAGLPTRFALEAARPNPFARTTAISLALPRAVRVEVALYDATGKLVRVLASSEQPAGRLILNWDGRDLAGRLLPEGVYYCRARAGDYRATGKLVIQR
jgi:hypothetical protein